MCLCLFLCHSMCDVSVFIFSKQRLHGAELSQSNLWVTGSWTPGKLQAAASQQERPSQSVQQISCRSTIMLHWTSLDSNCERKLSGKTSYNIGKILFCFSIYQEVHFVKILLFFLNDDGVFVSFLWFLVRKKIMLSYFWVVSCWGITSNKSYKRHSCQYEIFIVAIPLSQSNPYRKHFIKCSILSYVLCFSRFIVFFALTADYQTFNWPLATIWQSIEQRPSLNTYFTSICY